MELHPGVSQPEHRRFAWEECDDALTGFWLALDARWVNHPSRYLEASRKPYQLAVAQAAGLAVPRTCITNDPAEARRFADELSDRQIVYKAFSGTPSLWTETQLLGPQMLAQVDAVRLAPVIFQEYVPGCDLRVTVVGDRVFAARIDASDTSYPLDWRVDPGRARIEAAELPGSVAEPLLRLHRRLGLLYGACDLRLTPDGEHVFLEVNPAGQWLFAEQGAGLPISDALADLLTDRRGGMGLSHGDERCVL